MIQSDYFWYNVFFLSLGTMAIRFSFIALSTRVLISDRMKEIFSFIPAAILPALIAPMVFFHQGTVAWALGKERVLVLVASTVVCVFTGSTLITIGFGLIALYLMSMLH